MNKTVIFGASSGGVKVAKTFKSLGIEFEFFVDNGADKWGTYLEGKIILDPNVLANKDYHIVIASIYQEEIEEQLSNLGINVNQIVPKEKYILAELESRIDKYRKTINPINNFQNEKTYIIDLANGLEIGGIETWSFELARALKKFGEKSYIYTSNTKEMGPSDLKNQIIKLKISYEEYEESIITIMNHMINAMPCVIVSNWMTQNFMAAYILKLLFPDKVTILGIVHHDMLGYYRRNKFLEDKIKKFICVSCDTRQRMVDEFDVNAEKVIYKEVIIPYDNLYIKKKSITKNPLVINFASRLVKAQKRADLIIPLITELEKNKVNYVLNIAGEGKYYDLVSDYMNANVLHGKVNLFGAIEYSEMTSFWKLGDVVISLSDSEGMGLSILEGMSYGLVPVVTNTAGISDFIYNGENGFICNLHDVKQICNIISLLNDDREYLNKLSLFARDTIRERCSDKSYVDLIKSI